MLLPPVDARRSIDTHREFAVAPLSPELRRSCNELCRVLKASGHLHDDPALAPLWQGDGVQAGLDLPPLPGLAALGRNDYYRSKSSFSLRSLTGSAVLATEGGLSTALLPELAGRGPCRSPTPSKGL